MQIRIRPALNTLPILDESEASQSFAQALIERGVLTEKFRDDARHLGVAIIEDCDAIISWNFRHMVNPARRRQI